MLIGGRYRVRCPECLAFVFLKDTVELWAPITCAECHTSLEVISLDPLELGYMDEPEDPDDVEVEEDF